MIDGLKIERAVSADLKSAYIVYEQAIALAFEKEGVSEDAKDEIAYKKSLIRESVQAVDSKLFFLVAKLQGRVIGTISFGPCGDDVRGYINHELDTIGELGGLYILPTYQGRGVASALITAMLKHLHNEGVERFCLDCGLKEAQKLWLRKFGTPCTVVKDYWGKGSDQMIWLCNVDDCISGFKIRKGC